MVRLTYQHAIARAALALRGAWYFGDFCNIFLPNIDEDLINILTSERGAPGTVRYDKSGPGYCNMLTKKVSLGPEGATFRAKTLNFTHLYI